MFRAKGRVWLSGNLASRDEFAADDLAAGRSDEVGFNFIVSCVLPAGTHLGSRFRCRVDFSIGQLRECHGPIVLGAGQRPHPLIATVPRDNPGERAIKALTAAGVEARYFELDNDLGHSSSGPEHAKWSPVLRQFLAPLGIRRECQMNPQHLCRSSPSQARPTAAITAGWLAKFETLRAKLGCRLPGTNCSGSRRITPAEATT